MTNVKKNVASATGLVAALASTLCCIAPILSILGGVIGGISMFAWVAPLRPYLIGVSVMALSYSFYEAYKPKVVDDCGCAIESNPSFLNSKGFLWGVTLLSVFLFSFPHISTLFHNPPVKENYGAELVSAHLTIEGMTCSSCEHHVATAVLKLDGVYEVEASFQKGNAKFKYDAMMINMTEISNQIETETGYKVKDD